MSVVPFMFSVVTSMCMYYKLALFGHSYVRDLASLGESEIFVSGVRFCLNYFSVPGATFSTFASNPVHIENLKIYKPDYIIVVLGGNDLKIDVELSQIYEDCSVFYKNLREICPDSVIIASQIENRFYELDNRFNSPPAKTFDYLRRHFNRFLKNKPFKDFLLQVQGPNRLDKKENYRDSVHLSHSGLRKYFAIIRSTLSYALENKIRTV